MGSSVGKYFVSGLILLSVLLLLTSIYLRFTTGSYTPYGDWTDARKNYAQLWCTEKEGPNSQEKTLRYLFTYCSCVVENLSERWSYSEYREQEAGLLELLREEGVVSACRVEAGDEK